MRDFAYSRTSSVAEAIRANASDKEARFLAGGSNLIDLARYGVENPGHLIDITHLPLAHIDELKGGGLRVGALVKNSEFAEHPRVKRDYPVLSQALLSGASPQLRNMATTGGNLLQRTRCYYFYDTALPCNKREPGSGCPAIEGYNRIHAILGGSASCIAVHPSDMCVALALLDAVVNVEGPRGRRQIKIHEFHRLPGDTPQIDTTLERDELITSVDIPPIPMAKRSSYLKIRDRQSYAFALVSIAAALQIEGGRVKEARIAMGGVAHKPWRSFEAERILRGQPAAEESYRLAAEAALAGAKGCKYNSFKIEIAKRAIVRSLSDLSA